MESKKLKGSPIAYYVSRADQGEWALFLHAAFVDHDMFRTQVEHFQGRRNVLLVDVLGHGRSTDAHKDDSIDKMSEWIAGILEAEGIDKAHVVGVSLGAVLAQDLANRHPGSVRSLACFGGYDINNFDASMQKDNASKQMLMTVRALFSTTWFAKANKAISAYTPEAQEEFYAMNLRFPRKSFKYLAGLNGMVNKHVTGERGYPLLIGCGEFDVPMELEALKRWKESEPDCAMVVLSGAGHCANMDVPQEFNETLERFWSGEGPLPS